jgi:outer membrane protease
VIAAALILETGASLVTASGSLQVLGAPSLADGSSLDLKMSSMSLDYANQPDPSQLIRAQLKDGFTAISSAEGIMTSSRIAGRTGLGWSDDADSKSILVKYAYFGDVNLDGVVDSTDFATLAAHFGETNGNWAGGDFNYDGTINALDFNALATNYGATLSPEFLSTLVPEPTSLGGAGIALMLLMQRRFSKTKGF